MDVNSAILERLEKVVSTLQENSVKMGQLLAVHNEKLDKQDRIDAVLFEKVESVHREVNRRAQVMEKKMWTIFGALSIISFMVSPVGQKIIRNLQVLETSVTIESRPSMVSSESISRPEIY